MKNGQLEGNSMWNIKSKSSNLILPPSYFMWQHLIGHEVKEKMKTLKCYQIALQKSILTFFSPHKCIRVLCLKLSGTNKGKRGIISLNTYPY